MAEAAGADTAAPPDRRIARHQRRNVAALGLEISFFVAGLGFTSINTVSTAFAERLGAPNVVIGAIPAIASLGWFLPGILVAGYSETLPRKFPFVARLGLLERVPFLFAALLAFTLAVNQPGLALVAFLVLLVIWSAGSGLTLPPWLDMIGHLVPAHLRGRFFALSGAIGGLLATLSGAAAGYLLASFPFPQNYGLCFLAGFGMLAISYGAFLFTREPSVAVAPAPPARAYFRRLPSVMAADPNFGRYLVARGLILACKIVVTGFSMAYALKVLGGTEAHVGLYTTTYFVADTLGTLALGSVADRGGHKRVVALGAAGFLAAGGLALAISGAAEFAAVFALVGIADAAINVSGFAILLEFASERDRPTYVGLGNVALTPFALAAPLLGGWLADSVGFGAVFGLAVGLSGAGLAVLTLGVRDPRTFRHGAAQQAGR